MTYLYRPKPTADALDYRENCIVQKLCVEHIEALQLALHACTNAADGSLLLSLGPRHYPRALHSELLYSRAHSMLNGCRCASLRTRRQ
jgi:hypothetical protein